MKRQIDTKVCPTKKPPSPRSESPGSVTMLAASELNAEADPKLGPLQHSTHIPIRATIVGSNRCEALGVTGRGSAPVLALCRALVAAGHDPRRPLHVYRDDVLALKVRSINEGAKLIVREDRAAPRFVPWESFPRRVKVRTRGKAEGVGGGPRPVERTQRATRRNGGHSKVDPTQRVGFDRQSRLIAMVFGIWQPLYAAHGIAIFPVGIDERGKVPKTRGWQSIGLRGSAKLAQTMADADAFGFCLGKRSGLTILDIDSSDERILAEALDRHGPTPILVRSGSGNYQGWYRHNGETRRIRPDPNKPIDILGSGFVVAPPSKGMKSNYKFVQGGLDDLVTLPCLRNVLLSGVEVQVGRIGQGNRNNALFEHCMRQARHCDDFDALIDVAHTSNATFSPPLPDDEVVKIAKSAWDYTQRGENRFGRHGVFFSTEEVNQLIARGPDQFTLLAFLRANNGPESAFMVANGLAKEFGWGPKRLAATRRRLEGTEIKMVKRPSAKNGPARYRWLNKAGRK